MATDSFAARYIVKLVNGTFYVDSNAQLGTYNVTEADGSIAQGDAVTIDGAGNALGTFQGTMYNGGIVVQATNGTYYLYTDQTTGLSRDLNGTPNLDNDGTPLGAPGSTPVYTVCFLAGTLIATPDGERPIEALAIGDLVTLANGERKPIKWVGRMTTKLHRFNRPTASPILIRAGALGGGLPNRDLYTSYRHGFALEGVLVVAGLLVNGTSIIQCTDWPDERVTMYQIEVDGHELMLAEGATTETFGEDGDNRALFDNADEYRALYPDAQPSEPMALGRVIVARQVPRAVKERIAAAAAELERASKVA